MSDTHTISLNGHKYDPLTGKPVKIDNEPKHPHNKKIVDGFFNTGAKSKHHLKSPTSKDLSTTKAHHPHSVAPHITRVTQRSKTLMRTAVNKPAVTKIKEQPKIAKRKIDHAVSRGVEASAPVRASMLDRANAIKQSEFVGKFNELTTPANPISPDPTSIQTTANSEVHLKNLDQLSQIESNPTKNDIFTEAALKLADSNVPTAPRKEHFYDPIAVKLHISVKTLLIISIILFVIILGLITTYIFSSDISIYLANSKTGIHGTLPGYKPAGFGLKSIDSAGTGANGYINLKYTSNSDSRAYSIGEQYTTWDNQALISSVITPQAGTQYTTSEYGGRTVYTYGKYTVWVSGGVYYNLLNNAGLTSNQISQIVTTS